MTECRFRFQSDESTIRKLDPADGSLLSDGDRLSDLVAAGASFKSWHAFVNGDYIAETGRFPSRCPQAELILWDISSGSPVRKWRASPTGQDEAVQTKTAVYITDNVVWFMNTDFGASVLYDKSNGHMIRDDGPVLPLDNGYRVNAFGEYLDVVGADALITRYDEDGNEVDNTGSTSGGLAFLVTFGGTKLYYRYLSASSVDEIPASTFPSGTNYSYSPNIVGTASLISVDDTGFYIPSGGQLRKYKAGNLLWTNTTEYSAGAPTAWNGKVVMSAVSAGSYNGNIDGVNPTTGAKLWDAADGSMLARVGSANQQRPALTADYLFTRSAALGDSSAAIDLSDGTTAWDNGTATGLGGDFVVLDDSGNPWYLGNQE